MTKQQGNKYLKLFVRGGIILLLFFIVDIQAFSLINLSVLLVVNSVF
ncbi:MAG: hypothetical protein ACI89T_001521 [Cognaticolwellia sp.]|jgi:hypothetical protein